MTNKREWDRHAIMAEVKRRGHTLTSISLEAGLNKEACRHGLNGNSKPGAIAVAEFLKVPFRELFPTLYPNGRHSEINPTVTIATNDRSKHTKSAVGKNAAA